MKNKTIDSGVIAFGEVGLSGEIRPVASGQERIKEAAKHGFSKVVVPKANAPKKTDKAIKVIAVDNLDELMAQWEYILA